MPYTQMHHPFRPASPPEAEAIFSVALLSAKEPLLSSDNEPIVALSLFHSVMDTLLLRTGSRIYRQTCCARVSPPKADTRPTEGLPLPSSPSASIGALRCFGETGTHALLCAGLQTPHPADRRSPSSPPTSVFIGVHLWLTLFPFASIGASVFRESCSRNQPTP